MFSVSALGELLIDFTDAGTSAGGQRLFERNAGGAPANVLVALQKLGHQTAFLGKVGKDMHGDFLRATLEEQGIDTRGLISDPDAFTTLAFVALSPDGERERRLKVALEGATMCQRFYDEHGITPDPTMANVPYDRLRELALMDEYGLLDEQDRAFLYGPDCEEARSA